MKKHGAQDMNGRFSKTLAALTMSALLLAAGSAYAQWGWTDEAGKKQFSDQPPPAAVPDKNVFKRPPGSALLTGGPVYGTQVVGAKPGTAQAAAAALAASAAQSGASAPAASAPAPTASKPKTADEKFKDRQEEKAKAEEQAKQKAQADAKMKADCDRSRGYMKTLNDGGRVARTDAQGNRNILDDAQRASETQRVQSEISANCK
jgi:hypothetical protein